MKTLVTGANGFLGSALVRALVAQGHSVRAFVRDASRAQHLQSLPVELFTGTLWSRKSIDAATEGMDVVFHLAATMGGSWAEYLEGTIRGTERLARAAVEKHVHKFIYVSSIAVYGIPSQNPRIPVTEQCPYAKDGLDDYMRSKIEAERIILDFMKREHLSATIIRPGVIYGRGGKRWLPRIGYQFHDAIVVKIGVNSILLPVTYVENVVSALILAATSEKSQGKIYNVVDDARFTQSAYLRAFAGHACRYCFRIYFPYFVASWTAAIARKMGRYVGVLNKIGSMLPEFHLKSCSRQLIYDNSRIKAELGWQPDPNVERHLNLMFDSSSS